MRLIDGIPVWGDPDPGALAQIQVCDRFADHVALMADNHKGYGVPIGGVMASREMVSPTGVGYDIGCFPGETRVLLLDGTQATLAELHERGSEFWVVLDRRARRNRPRQGAQRQNPGIVSAIRHCIERRGGSWPEVGR